MKKGITDLTNAAIKFRNDRHWEKFHTPQNLATALSIEASELLECYLWKRGKDVDTERIEEELADVLIYAFMLANAYKFNISDIINRKITKNEKNYPLRSNQGVIRKKKI